MTDAAIDATLAAMRQRYVEASRGFLATFSQIGDQLSNTPDSDDLLTALRRELHRVRGTAGSLGFLEAGRLAGALEGLTRRWCEDPSLDRHRRSSIVSSFARTLAEALVTTAAADAQHARRVMLVGLADPVADRLVAEALHRGLAVERVKAAPLASATREAPPWGVIAMEGSAELVAASFGDVTCVLLREDTAPSAVHRASAATVLDVATAPAEIIDLLERVAGQGGRWSGTVLLVDDDPMMLLLLRALAERDGLLVETAASGEAFRDAMSRIDPAIVVLDVELPDADGIALLRTLRSDRRHRDLPVLILSGRADSEARESAFGAGADDYMLKPVVPSEFQRRVGQLLEQRRARRVSTGLHPASGLLLPVRTMQELEAGLASRGETEWSVVVLRPAEAQVSPEAMAAWQAECIRLARAAHEAGGIAGLTKESGLAMALPFAPRGAEELLHDLAGLLTPAAPLWHSGVVGTNAISACTVRVLLGAASDACLAALDAGAPARIWDPSDVDIAPDVIVVEDDEALAEMLTFALEARGLTYRWYANGPDGLAALLRLRVHGRSPIVLLDVDLPGMDGHSLHERLRLERPDVFHVVFISLHTSEADQLRALQGGALDYLTKPVSLRVLMAKLAVWRERLRAG